MCSSAFAHAQEKDVSKSKCNAPPYGATVNEYKTFMKTSVPGIHKKDFHAAIELMCNVKFTDGDRSIINQMGITDEDINNKSTAELAIDLLKGSLKAIKEAQAEIANCDAPPYGTADNNYKAYAMTFTPSLGQEASDKIIAFMCRIKYKGADRSGTYKLGITDKDIDKKDTPDLAIAFMRGIQKAQKSNE